MAKVVDTARSSWICPTQQERARFLDLNARLLPVNTKVFVLVLIAVGSALPVIYDEGTVVPALAGIVLFGIVQRVAIRMQRPEVWVFTGLLGAEAMVVATMVTYGGITTPAVALMAWPVAGIAGRFHNRVVVVATAYAMALVSGAILLADPGVLRTDPLALTLPLVGLFAVAVVSVAHRDSDIEHRGAAILDQLTGMLNRSALARRTAEIEHQSALSGQPVGLIVLDLDHFKAVNDEHGHATGDAVLRDVAYLLRRELRAYDLAYRMGGEEFVIVLLGADVGTAAELGERLRAAVAEEPVAGIDVSLSVGVAGSAEGTRFVWDDVFARADRALYDAKRGGRDRVVVDRVAQTAALVPVGV